MTSFQGFERQSDMWVKRLFKRIAASEMAGRMTSLTIGSYIRIVDSTSRWDYIGREHAAPLLDGERGFLVALWHQRLMMTARLRRETTKHAFMLVSSHRDGEIIANAVRGYGIKFIRGSATNPKKKFKDKGGAPAIAEMLTALKDGHIVCVTPDGPRGPGRKAQAGIVRLAQMSGAPILPLSNAASRGRYLSTWDRFFVPAPFSRGCFAAGEPISIAQDAPPEAVEETRQKLETTLNETTALAEAHVGRSPDRGVIS